MIDPKVTHELIISDAKGEVVKKFECYSMDDADRVKTVIYRLLHYKLDIKDFSYSIIDLEKQKNNEQEKQNLLRKIEIEKQKNILLKQLKELDQAENDVKISAIDAMKNVSNSVIANQSKVDKEIKVDFDDSDKKIVTNLDNSLAKLLARKMA